MRIISLLCSIHIQFVLWWQRNVIFHIFSTILKWALISVGSFIIIFSWCFWWMISDLFFHIKHVRWFTLQRFRWKSVFECSFNCRKLFVSAKMKIIVISYRLKCIAWWIYIFYILCTQRHHVILCSQNLRT